MSKGENEYIRELENDDKVDIIEKISICSDISDLTETSIYVVHLMKQWN